jgi:hypothetical protein
MPGNELQHINGCARLGSRCTVSQANDLHLVLIRHHVLVLLLLHHLQGGVNVEPSCLGGKMFKDDPEGLKLEHDRKVRDCAVISARLLPFQYQLMLCALG